MKLKRDPNENERRGYAKPKLEVLVSVRCKRGSLELLLIRHVKLGHLHPKSGTTQLNMMLWPRRLSNMRHRRWRRNRELCMIIRRKCSTKLNPEMSKDSPGSVRLGNWRLSSAESRKSMNGKSANARHASALPNNKRQENLKPKSVMPVLHVWRKSVKHGSVHELKDLHLNRKVL